MQCLFYPYVLLSNHPLFKSLPSKSWQHEAGLVDISIVVAVELLLLLWAPSAKGCLEVAVAVLAADHETNLTRWVGWDGSVGVLDVGEDFLAVLFELGDQWQVQPLVLGY